MNTKKWVGVAVAAAAFTVLLASPVQAEYTPAIASPCPHIISTDPTVNTVVRNCNNLVNQAQVIVVGLVLQAEQVVLATVGTVENTCLQDPTPVPLISNCLAWLIEQVPNVPTLQQIVDHVTAIANWVVAYSNEISAWQSAQAGKTDAYRDDLSAWAGTLGPYGVSMGAYVNGQAGYYSGYGLVALADGLCQVTGPQPCAIPGAPNAPGPEPTPEDVPTPPSYDLPPVHADVPVLPL